jgi:hypothetical protein
MGAFGSLPLSLLLGLGQRDAPGGALEIGGFRSPASGRAFLCRICEAPRRASAGVATMNIGIPVSFAASTSIGSLIGCPGQIRFASARRPGFAIWPG